jgi:hypothetical protein
LEFLRSWVRHSIPYLEAFLVLHEIDECDCEEDVRELIRAVRS